MAGPLRTLHLLRHAKSSWDDPTRPDHDRPLAPRGRRAALRLAAHLAGEGVRPELVLCSSARRTRETLDAIRPAFGEGTVVRVEDGLYGAGAGSLLVRLRQVDAAVESVLVIGHNPGLEELAIKLAGDGEAEATARLHRKFPTAALATLDMAPAAWSELAPGTGYLVAMVTPRDLERRR